MRYGGMHCRRQLWQCTDDLAPASTVWSRTKVRVSGVGRFLLPWGPNFHLMTTNFYLRQDGGHGAVFLSFCRTESRITAKVIRRFHRAYQSEELINFWWWSGAEYRFRITFLLQLLRNGIFGDFLAFPIQSPAGFCDTRRNVRKAVFIVTQLNWTQLDSVNNSWLSL